MAAIDNLINRMVSRDVHCVVMENDRAMKLRSAGKEVEGPAITTENLNELLVEAAPAALKTTVLMVGRSSFSHQSAHGNYNVVAFRTHKGVKVTISKVTEAQIRGMGVAFAVMGIGWTVASIPISHGMVESSGKFFPVLIALGPALAVLGVYFAVTGKAPATEAKDRDTMDYVVYAAALVAGFIAYGLFKNGLI